MLTLIACSPRPEQGVEFDVVIPEVPEGETVFVAGSPEAWGGWRPDGVPLERTAPDRWKGIAHAPDGTHEFKYTLGSWEREGLKRNGFQRDNDLVQVVEGKAFVQDTVWGWSNGPAPKEPQGQLTGRIDTLERWKPTGLRERLVTAWVPEGPIDAVVILHDGRNVFDPASANFGVDWGVDDTLAVMDAAGWHVLAIAVDCTEDRSTDYGPGPEGKAYVDGLANDLLPRVQSRYGWSDETSITVCGASMGGLISYIALYEHPEVFDAAICMSPAFSYRSFRYSAGLQPKEHGPVWVDNGTVGLEEQLQPGVDDMVAHFEAAGATFTFRRYDEGRHFEADWGQRFGTAFRWVQNHLP